jgi:hypothetical protein
MNGICPIFLDGPLEGKEIYVPVGTRYFQAPDIKNEGVILTYNLRKFILASGEEEFTIILAYCFREPTAQKIAEHMLSDRAKKAIVSWQ